MHHCPECSTVITPAEGAIRADAPQGGLYLQTLSYNCPGCGRQYLHWVKKYASHEPVDQWFHVAPNGMTLLMHNPPDY